MSKYKITLNRQYKMYEILPAITYWRPYGRSVHGLTVGWFYWILTIEKI